jgi:hypothetical protein
LAADRNELKGLPIGHHVFNAIISRDVINYNDNTADYKPWKFESSYGSWPDEGQFFMNDPFKIGNGGIKYN